MKRKPVVQSRNENGNVEYRRSEEGVVGVPMTRRPLWPCREKIAGVVYDKLTSYPIAKAGNEHIYRTSTGEYFFASDGEHIRPCGKGDVVESILVENVAPAYFGDFRYLLPSVFRAEA
jgi:hypothetical protein